MLTKIRNVGGSVYSFFTDAQITQLLLNGSLENHGKDHIPAACLEFNVLGYKWLITELSPQRSDIAYGLINFSTKLYVGFISLSDLDNLTGEPFLSFQTKTSLTFEEMEQAIVVPNKRFIAHFPLSIYFSMAKKMGSIPLQIDYKAFLRNSLCSNLN